VFKIGDKVAAKWDETLIGNIISISEFYNYNRTMKTWYTVKWINSQMTEKFSSKYLILAERHNDIMKELCSK